MTYLSFAHLRDALAPSLFTHGELPMRSADAERAVGLLLEIEELATRAAEIASADPSVWSDEDLSALTCELEPPIQLLRSVFRRDRNPREA